MKESDQIGPMVGVQPSWLWLVSESAALGGLWLSGGAS
jgi:hypothetical protein